MCGRHRHAQKRQQKRRGEAEGEIDIEGEEELLVLHIRYCFHYYFCIFRRLPLQFLVGFEHIIAMKYAMNIIAIFAFSHY